MYAPLLKYGLLYNAVGTTGNGSEYNPIPVGTVDPTVQAYPSSCTLNGRAFATNTSFEPYRREAFRHRTIQPQRQSINFENVAGFGTLNTEGLWRRDQMDWSAGAGQLFLDRKAESNSSRFYKSDNMDVWTENQLTFLPDTTNIIQGANKAIAVNNDIWAFKKNGNGTGAIAAWATTTSYTIVAGNYYYDTNAFDNLPIGGGLEAGQTVTINVGYDTDPHITQIAGKRVIASMGTISIFGFTYNTITITGTWTAFGSSTSRSAFSSATMHWDLLLKYVSGIETYQPKLNYETINDIATDGFNVYVACSNKIGIINSLGVFSNYVLTGQVTRNTIRIECSGADSQLTGAGLFGMVSVGMSVIGDGTNSSHFASDTIVTNISLDEGTVTLNKPLSSALTVGQGVIFTLQEGVNIASYNRIWVANDIVMASASTGGSTSNARIMCAFASAPTATAAPVASDLLMIHPNVNWDWTGATGGATQIYMCGKAGYKGAVYRASWSDASNTANGVTQPFALHYPISCLPMEGNEYPTCIYAYLNFVFIGTNLGIRMCQTLNQYDPSASNGGDLKAGPLAPNLLQPVSLPVHAIAGNGRFIYFGWSHYRPENGYYTSCIGRMDLSHSIANDALSIAYASDRTYSTNATDVTWIDWDPSRNCPLVTVNNGAYIDNGSKTDGFLHCGYVTYGISDDKIPVKFDAAANVSADSYIEPTLEMVSPNGTSYDYSMGQFSGKELVTNGQYRSERIGFKHYIKASHVYRLTLQSWPAVVTETNITPVFLLYRNNVSGPQVWYTDPYEAMMFIQDLIETQQIVEYTEGPLTANVVVQGFDWLPHKENNDYEHGFVGDIVVTLKTIGGYTYTPTPTQ